MGGCVSNAQLNESLQRQEIAFQKIIDETIEKLGQDSNASQSYVVSQEQMVIELPAASPRRRKLRKDGYDIFISHSKKFPDSEDRAVWVADVVEGYGLRPFFDRSDLVEINEPALKKCMLLSDVCVTVVDPVCFNSSWVFAENLLAANAGIPIVPIYDGDRYRWEQLTKWQKLYPWAFGRQAVELTKSKRRESTDALISAISAAKKQGRVKPKEMIKAEVGGLVDAKVGVGGSSGTETRAAVESAFRGMRDRLGGDLPSFMVCTFTCTHDADKIAAQLHEIAPTVPMIGCTTCQGLVLNDRWLSHNRQFALGLWGLSDDAGSFTTIHIRERPPSGIRDAVLAEVTGALKLRQMKPSFAILLGSPGDEELVLDGMQVALGKDVPILGGSSADNNVEGSWRQIAKVGSAGLSVGEATTSKNGIAIAIAWVSCETTTVLTSGFRKTNKRGVVTKVDDSDHGRTILEIDGKPVQGVYEDWSEGKITKGVTFDSKGVANVLASSSFCPLGEPCGSNDVRVMHPVFLNSTNGALTTFANAREGMEIFMLDAAPETMAEKISSSAKSLVSDSRGSSAGPFDATKIVGALSIFCGGLVMALGDQMGKSAEELAEVLGQKNSMAVCCFGEQGMNCDRRATHGNLMFGCLLLFSNRKPQLNLLQDNQEQKANGTAVAKAVKR